MFVEGLGGIMMEIVESLDDQYGYVIWFPYTKNSINAIREGTLVAVKNFATNNDWEYYSILQITSIMPHHYALGKDRSGYPGFVEEAAVSAAQDWLQETPTEETTKIICKASPTNMEIKIKSFLSSNSADIEPCIQPESNLPMIGEKAQIINTEWTGKIVNRDLEKMKEKTISIGNLSRMSEVDVLILWEELVRIHFGIFAFTGAGKSNLTSTCIAKMLSKSDNLKVVVYDIMGEYLSLLIDQLSEWKDSRIICIGRETVPVSLVNYWENQQINTQNIENNLKQIAVDLTNTTLLPKALKPIQNQLIFPIMDWIKNRKMLFYFEHRLIGPVLGENRSSIVRGYMGAATQPFNDFIDNMIQRYRYRPFTEDIQNEINTLIEDFTREQRNIGQILRANIQTLRNIINREIEEARGQERINPQFRINLNEIVNILNDKSKKSLFLIQSNNEERLRLFTARLGRRMLGERRQAGEFSPPISFIFDEADSFIPSSTDQEDIIASRAIAQEIARRGRKYGFGIGIATQRIVYLDSNILGQPHTYFVSKLPRQVDRQRIQEAFGISDEALRQTLKFKKGQWLLISYDATGIENLPIPITVPDANERVRKFLSKYAGKLTPYSKIPENS